MRNPGAVAPPRPKNLIVVVLESVAARWLEPYGSPYPATPILGAEARHALVFDAFYAPVAFRVRTYGLDVGSGQAWVDTVLAHPAMLDWEAQGLAETWREDSHEAELAAAGTVTADYRQS